MLEAETLSSLSFIPRTNFDVSLFFSTQILLHINTTLLVKPTGNQNCSCKAKVVRISFVPRRETI